MLSVNFVLSALMAAFSAIVLYGACENSVTIPHAKAVTVFTRSFLLHFLRGSSVLPGESNHVQETAEVFLPVAFDWTTADVEIITGKSTMPHLWFASDLIVCLQNMNKISTSLPNLHPLLLRLPSFLKIPSSKTM